MIGLIAPAGPEKVALLPGCRIGAHLVESGVFEPESLAAWVEAVQPGKTVLDVGSYTGLYAIAAAKKGARAVAMEPMPHQRARLRENVRLNKVEPLVNVVPMAASDKNGAIDLWFNPRVNLTSAASAVKGPGCDSFTVYGTQIDDLRLKDVAAIKIDAERHEVKVLRGAIKTITRDRPTLIIEVLDDRQREEVKNVLPSFYRIAAVLDVRNVLLKPLGQ